MSEGLWDIREGLIGWPVGWFVGGWRLEGGVVFGEVVLGVWMGWLGCVGRVRVLVISIAHKIRMLLGSQIKGNFGQFQLWD